MKINPDDLYLYPVLTGEEILGLFFKEAAQYLTGDNIPVKHTQSVEVAREFIDWVTRIYEGGSLFIIETPSFKGRGIIWFKKCKFNRDAFFKLLKTKKIMSRLQKRGERLDQKLIKAIEYSDGNNQIKKKLPPKPTTKKAIIDSLHKSFITNAAKILESNPHLTGPEVLNYSSLRTLIRNSGLPEYKYPKDEHILKKWMPEVRKRAGVQSKHDSKKAN